jgi:hypothetical protein
VLTALEEIEDGGDQSSADADPEEVTR